LKNNFLTNGKKLYVNVTESVKNENEDVGSLVKISNLKLLVVQF